MGAYTYRSSGAVVTHGTGGNLDLSSAAPAGRQAGDLLLLYSGQRGSPTSVSVSAEWTELILSFASGGTGVWGRIADGTSADLPTTLDWNAANPCFAWIEAWSGDVYTDLSTIVAHSAIMTGTATSLQLPGLTGATVNDCLVIGFGLKNNTATDATTISHSVLTKRTQYVSSVASRMHAASGSLQQTTAADYGGTDFTIDGTSESLASRGVVLYLRSLVSTQKYVKLLAEAAAASVTGIEGVVLNAARDTVIGEFTGQAFEAALEGGEAVLLIPVSEITPDGSTLTTSDAPLVAAYNSTHGTVGLGSATVIEE